jgi:phosphoribosyl 1,2-cyclic phosphodiesterase
MLPQLHGIEILRKVKGDPRTKHIGVIISSAHAMIQNFNAAIQNQADYFLEKPFEISRLLTLFKHFFQGGLQPAPYISKDLSSAESKHCYLPKMHSAHSYVKFWGSRGSNPVAGPDYIRFGGNTCCLEIRNGNDLIIIDAGTGIRALGNAITQSKAKNVHLLLSHTHWDHIGGFPFFAPIYDSDCHIHLWTPIGFEKPVKELFTDMLAHAYFPVRLDDIQSKISFRDIHEGIPFEIGNFIVDTHYAFHPGATLAFKIKAGKTTLGYATDNEFLMGHHGNPNAVGKNHPLLKSYRSMIEFFKECDFLIHEAQYTPLEYLSKVGWGHSSISNAAVLMKYAEIHEWIITHHDPGHNDAALLNKMQMQFDIIDDCKLDCRARMAFDGLLLPL